MSVSWLRLRRACGSSGVHEIRRVTFGIGVVPTSTLRMIRSRGGARRGSPDKEQQPPETASDGPSTVNGMFPMRPSARGTVTGFGVVRAAHSPRRDSDRLGDASSTSTEDTALEPVDNLQALRRDLLRFHQERSTNQSEEKKLTPVATGTDSASATPRAAGRDVGEADPEHAAVTSPAAAGSSPNELNDLQKLQLTRLRYMREVGRRDAADVLRGRSQEYVTRLPQLDPVEKQRRRDAAATLVSRIDAAANTATRADAVLQVASELSDSELRDALHAGVIDVFDLSEEADHEEAATAIPHEFLRSGLVPTTIAQEIAEITCQPATPTDEEAATLDLFERGQSSDFTAAQLQTLKDYELRQASQHHSQSNAVLKFVADRDPSVRGSLDALDRAKRATLRDAEFQAALLHVRHVGERDVEKLVQTSRPTPRTGASDKPFLVGDGGNAPPPGFALSAHDESPSPSKAPQGSKRKDRVPSFSQRPI